MTTKTKSENDKESPKGENPPEEKVVDKVIEQRGKTFEGKGTQVRK